MGAFMGPIHGPINGPINGSINWPMSGSISGPINGPFNGPYLELQPLNFLCTELFWLLTYTHGFEHITAHDLGHRFSSDS